jgi:hypothetical protein
LKNVSVNGNINYNCFSVELSPIVGHIHDNLQLDCHEKADNNKLTNSSSVKPEILNSKAEYYECDNLPANYQKSKKLITTPRTTNKEHYEVDDSNVVHNNYKKLTVPIKSKRIQPFESDDDELHDNIQLKTVVPPKNIKPSKSNNKQRYVDSEIIPGNYIEKTISTSSGDNSPAHYEKSKKLIATPSATNKEHYEEDDSDVVHNNYKTLTKLPNERKQIIVSDFEDDQPLVNLKPNIIKPSKLSAPKTPIQRKLRSSKIDLDESNMSMKRSPTLSFEQQNNKKKSNK